MTQSYSSIIFKRFRKNKLAFASMILIVFLLFMALFAPWMAPYEQNAYDLDQILQAPSSSHWLGTDDQGRDLLSQIIWGSRVSFSVGILSVALYVVIGILLGGLAGYYGGWIDLLISRLIEVMICFPTFFFILALLAFVGPSIYNIMIVIGLTQWTGIARLVRGEFLKLREQEYVKASYAIGAKDGRIMFRHLLPNSLAPVLVASSFGIATTILIESSLSFLGFGVPGHIASWGNLLSQARIYMDIAWWITFAPGVMIFITITAYNLIGDGLREAVDAKSDL